MKNIFVFLADGFEEIEAITPIDLWRRAEFNVITVSISNNIEVCGAHNIKVKADVLFKDADFTNLDMIFLPGGMPGSRNLVAFKPLADLITQSNSNKKRLTAICAAPIVYGKMGLLKKRMATCYPGFENELEGANHTSNPIEIDEHFITAKGAGIAYDFALKVIEIYKGKEASTEIATKTMYK